MRTPLRRFPLRRQGCPNVVGIHGYCRGRPKMSEPVVEQLTRADEPAAVASLAAAFASYPLFPPLCPNATRRPRVIEAFCRYLFRMALRCDGAFGTADRTAVVCTWPAGWEWPSRWASLRRGGLTVLWRLGWRGTRLLAR